MTFESAVSMAIMKESPEHLLYSNKLKFASTSIGQDGAVYINTGISHSDVILYYWSNGALTKKMKTFEAIFEASQFARELLEMIPKKRHAEVAYNAVSLDAKKPLPPPRSSLHTPAPNSPKIPAHRSRPLHTI